MRALSEPDVDCARRELHSHVEFLERHGGHGFRRLVWQSRIVGLQVGGSRADDGLHHRLYGSRRLKHGERDHNGHGTGISLRGCQCVASRPHGEGADQGLRHQCFLWLSLGPAVQQHSCGKHQSGGRVRSLCRHGYITEFRYSHDPVHRQSGTRGDGAELEDVHHSLIRPRGRNNIPPARMRAGGKFVILLA